MINVNLLPYHLRPVKRTPLPYILSAVLVLTAVALMAMAYLGSIRELNEKQAILDQHSAELAELRAIVEESNDLEAQIAQLADKQAAIEEIVKDRIIWSKQLWKLGELAPDNFWYQSIETAKRNFFIRQPEIDKKTGKQMVDPVTKEPRYKTVSQQRPVLEVSGFVIDAPDGTRGIDPLMDSTTEDEEFSNIFELVDFERGYDTADEPATEFTLIYRIRPGGAE